MTEQTQDHSKDTLLPTEPRAGGRAIGVLFAFIIVAGIVGYTILSRQERAAEPPTVSTSGAGHGLNVLLITVDSLRPDFLGCYGGAGAETPAIDALASNGVRFAHAVTAVPITRPSVATILTGLNPPRHGVRDDGPYPLADAHETLAETLKSAGYATAAFVGSFLLDARYGLNQGFDVYDDDMVGGLRSQTSRFDPPHRRGQKVVDAALSWLDQYHERNTTMPFFLWVDLFDAQSSFAPPEPFASRYPRQPYRRKVAFVDHQIGRITDALRERSLEDRTLILLVGTHGHTRGEHFEDGHGLLLYESTVAVPMIWHCPPLLGEPRVDDQHLAATVDVVPSVLDLLGIPAGPPRDGTDMIHNPRQADEAVYIESLAPRLRHGWSPLFAYRRLTDKVIHAPTPEYYQLRDDPGERKNLFAEATVRATELHTALQKYLDSLGAAAVDAATNSAPFADTLNQLSEMGYRLSEEESSPRVFPDPKLIMPSFDQLQIAVYLLKTGRLAESGGRFDAAVQASPYDGVIWGEFGKALARMGAFGGALEAELKAVHYQPRARHWIALAEMFAREHDSAAMEVALKQMAVLDPNDGGIWLVRGKSAAAQNRYDEALEHFAHARRVDPARSSADAYALAGDVHRAQGQMDQAKEAYDLALTFDAKHVIALEGLAGLAQAQGNMIAQINHMQQLVTARPGTILYVNTLAKLYMRVDRGQDAIQLMERYVARNPDDVAALGNLGNTYSEMNRFKKAVDTYRRAIEMAPDYPIPRFNLGDALARLDDPDGAIEQYRKVIELSPTHTKTYLRLIKTLVGQDRLDEAFEVLEQAVARSDIKEEMLAHDDAMASLVGSPRFRAIFSQRRQPNP